MGLFDFLSPDAAYEPVECLIKVDGEEISDLYPFLVEVNVNMVRNQPTICQLKFDSMRDETGNWNVQDKELLLPWKELEIIAAFGDQEETVMKGFIKDVQSDYPTQMASAGVIVRGQDESLLLDRVYSRKTWSTEEAPLRDDEIIQQITGEVGLSVETEEGLTNTYLCQVEPNIRFIRKRAEANGFEFYVRNGTLYFKEPQLEIEPQAVIMVYAGQATNCFSFTVNHDGYKPDFVHVSRAKEMEIGVEEETISSNLPLLGRQGADSTSLGLPDYTWTLDKPFGATFEEAKGRAQGKANENAWKISAQGELDGALYKHVLYNHAPVEVDGVGKVNNGIYYVDSVTHLFNQDGYVQKFKLLRNALGEEV
jgi:phage protein D